MTMKARAEYDWQLMGVRVVIGGDGHLVTWPDEFPHRLFHDPRDGTLAVVPEGRTEYLRLREDEARALYEALADYFGGTGHDTRALRRDYDAERHRVDRMLEALLFTPMFTGGATKVKP